MFTNRISLVEIDKIQVDRSTRQRTDLTPDSVIDLAVTIGKSQWISPILVNSDTNTIIAGERRLTAVRALRDAMLGNFEGFSNPAEARNTLVPVCTCQVESWNNWNRIPTQLGTKLTDRDITVYEYIENTQRKDLSWQDRAQAIYRIHEYGVTGPDGSNWTLQNTAQHCGTNVSVIHNNIKLWRLYLQHSKDSELKRVIDESNSLNAALSNAERYVSRREEDTLDFSNNTLLKKVARATPPTSPLEPLAKKSGPKPEAPPQQTTATSSPEIDWSESESLSAQTLINADFHEFAQHYDDEPFNFIHCDFPYGIDFNKSAQAKTVGNSILGEYDDSADVYWALLNTLKQERQRLIAPSCHIFFWFSQNHRRATEDFFTEMGGVVQPFLMIWHASEGSGLLPDAQRYGRRSYETAMLITFGDRKIVSPRALSYSATRNANNRTHRSEKPLPVLEHFFSMFVDSSSRVLDPTAGSGNAIIAAHHADASFIKGVEIDPKLYRSACRTIDNFSEAVTL